MRIFNRITLILASLMLMTVSCTNKFEEIFSIENDILTCDCTEQAIEQIMLCKGEYSTDCSEVDWITISPESGVSTGDEYITFDINVAYNKGDERTGTVYVFHNGQTYPIKVTQGKCNFTYGEPKVNGLISIGKDIDATLVIPYSGASGEEKVTLKGIITGDGAQGISIPEQEVSGFKKGSGELIINFSGTATTKGAVLIEIIIDGVTIATVPGRVSDGTSLEGLPVGWNLYALGYKSKDEALASPFNASWTSESTNPADHLVLPTSGNENARLGVVAEATNYTMNPGIQVQNMRFDNYWLMTIPVMNLAPTQGVTVEACVGGAGKSPGYFMLEYSADKQEWHEAPGAEAQGEAEIVCHYYVTPNNASVSGYENKRTTYDKATDEGYRKYTFALEGLKETIYDGNLYFRLRACADVRAVGTSKIDKAWGDLKGFEVGVVEGDLTADFLKLETTAANIDCMAHPVEITMSCRGHWTVDCGENSWITPSQTEGTGNGEDFVKFVLNVDYNSGEARTAVVNVMQGENAYPITITQGECKFAYGDPVFSGKLYRGTPSTAQITIPYVYASGKEEVRIRTIVSGEGAAGIQFPEITVSSFNVGKGEIVVDIKGTPEKKGNVSFEVRVDGETVGVLEAYVDVPVDPNALQGLSVGWNFYAADISPRGTEYDYSWSADAPNKTSEVLPYNNHKVLPSLNDGKTEPYMTAVSQSSYIGLADYTFNPGIQIKGMQENDAFLFVLPVKNFKSGQKVKIEACIGGAGSGAGHYMLEYSSDATAWYEAPGATEMTVHNGSTAVKCHYMVTPENASVSGFANTRKTYDKATDTGYKAYTFAMDKVGDVNEGTIYFRLRICANVRCVGGTAIGDAWADLKGFEITPVEE